MNEDVPAPACRMPTVVEGQVLCGQWRVGPSVHLRMRWGVSTTAATHPDGRRGVLEVFDDRLCHPPELRARLLRAGDTANRVGHPGAVRVLHVDVINSGVFLVLEPIEGRSVNDLVEESFTSRLGLRQALRIADGVLDVLVAAHAQGIVHGHIHGDTLIVDPRGVVRVLDFGVAVELLRHDELRSVAADFLAPELAQAAWERLDGRTDLWAVGALLFTLLAGRPVREAEGESLEARRWRAMTEPALPSREVLPDLPAAVAEVIDRALAFAPRDRWPDAASMQAAVRRALEHADDRPLFPRSKYAPAAPTRARDGGFVSPAALLPLRIELAPPRWRHPAVLAAAIAAAVLVAVAVGACVVAARPASGAAWGVTPPAR